MAAILVPSTLTVSSSLPGLALTVDGAQTAAADRTHDHDAHPVGEVHQAVDLDHDRVALTAAGADRRDADATEMDEVFLDADESEKTTGLPPVTTDQAGAPVVDARELHGAVVELAFADRAGLQIIYVNLPREELYARADARRQGGPRVRKVTID